MAERAELDRVRATIGTELSDAQAEALATYYAALSRAVAAFATDELRNVEPPLASTPGPRRP
jgi:hypothetical protein